MAKHIKVDLRDRSKEDYEMIAGFAVQALEDIANQPLSDEMNEEEIEDGWGCGLDEILEIQHDNHVFVARRRLQDIASESWKKQDTANG